MRIAHFSHLSSLLLLLLACLMAFTLMHGNHALHNDATRLQDYDRLQKLLTHSLQGTLRDYLVSGDSSRLTEAEKIRQRLLAQLGNFPTQHSQLLQQQLAAMGQRIKGDYLAAGKLSGNQQLLLQHAESELAAQARQLLHYGQQYESGEQPDPAVAGEYQRLAGEIL